MLDLVTDFIVQIAFIVAGVLLLLACGGYAIYTHIKEKKDDKKGKK